MMYDFRDLRFFQSDGTELDFWIESKTDGSSAVAWVKPERASQNRIYCFYGNPEATSRSNGSKTFDFFDDFSGSALSSLWTKTGTVTVSVSNSVLTLTGANDANAIIYSSASFGTGYAWRSYSKWGKESGYGSNFFGLHNSDAILFWDSDGYKFYTYKTATGHNYGGNCDSSYHIYEACRQSTDTIQFKIDNAVITTATLDIPTTALYLKMRHYGASVTQKHDWILIRKYTVTEPTVQVLSYGNRNPEYR
jgi:hypothetical protein